MTRCSLCNRPISDPKNIALGMGPICLKRSNKNPSQVKPNITSEKETESFLIEILKDTKFKNKVYSVGGFVRDDLLGLESKDLDIVVESPDGAKELGEFLHSRYPESTSNCYQIGAGYPIWHLAFKDNIEVNGKVFKTAGTEIDISDTQKESFPDPETRQRITQYGTIEEDIRRRDFTCNMVLRDLTTGKIIDKVNGVSDINSGILRGNPDVDLDKTFSDDPLRMIRLVRFHSKYGWKVPLSVLKKVRKNADRIGIVSQERIRDEFIKIMNMGKLSHAIRFMKATGLLKSLLPEVQAMDNVFEFKEGKLNRKTSLFDQAMAITEGSHPTVIQQMSSLLYNIQKNKTTQDELDNSVESIMNRLKFDKADTKMVKKTIDGCLIYSSAKDWTDIGIRKFIRQNQEALSNILDLNKNLEKLNNPLGNNMSLNERINKQNLIPIKNKSILSGTEIMSILGLKSGKEVGNAILALRDIEDDYAINGKILTEDEAKVELFTLFSK
jgi:poly(A) polymerase